jgi:hypothetical protein
MIIRPTFSAIDEPPQLTMVKPLLASEILEFARFRIAGYIGGLHHSEVLRVVQETISEIVHYQGLMRNLYLTPLDLSRMQVHIDLKYGPMARVDVDVPEDLLDEIDERLFNWQCQRCRRKYATREPFMEHDTEECDFYILTDVHAS